MRRIGSNIRKKSSEERSHRLTKNIIQYSDTDAPKNDYPRKIVSPTRPSSCCTDANKLDTTSTSAILLKRPHARRHSYDRGPRG